MKLKFPHILSGLTLFAATSAHSVTFVVGDGFALDGSGSFLSAPDDSPESSPGNTGRDNSIETAEFSSRYNLTQGGFTESPFGGSDPFVVGVISFGDPDVYRSSLQYDLSSLPAALPGFEWQVTDVTLFLEVAGTTYNNGVASGETVDVDVFANGDITAASLGASDASFTLDGDNDISGTFVSVVLPASVLDLNSDSSVTFVLDAGANPDTAAVFGTSLGAGAGIETGTTAVNRAPALRINAAQVAIPEPSAFSLVALAGLGLLARRRR